MRERRIGRALWGVQRKSFTAMVTYLNQKHDQATTKLSKKLDDIRTENNQIHQQISRLQPSLSGKENPPKPYIHVDSIETANPPRNPQHDFKIRWKKRIFGLNQKQVMAYIQDLNKLHEKELLELHEEMKGVLETREALRIQLAHDQISVHPAEEVAATVEVPEEDLRSAFVEEIKEQLLIEIKEIKEILVQNILKENIPGKNKELIVEERQELNRELPAKVIPIHHKKPKTFVPEETAPPSQPKESAPAAAAPQMQPRTSAPERAAPQMRQRMTAGGNSFWEEDIEQLLFEPHSWTSHQVAYDIYDPSSERVEEVHSPVYAAHAESRRSQAIADHVYDLRKKYIVGKIAGKDLLDSSGGWIITKNAVITENVLNKAEREGKLAELIVNMVIQGLGE